MSHFDAVTRVPDGFIATASTADAPVAALESDSRKIWGVQFHPEVVHSPHGMTVLQRFLYDLAGCTPSWTMDSIIDAQGRSSACAGRRFARDLCAQRWGRLGRGRSVGPRGDRSPTDVRVRRHRADAPRRE
jgi:hypothetical protein